MAANKKKKNWSTWVCFLAYLGLLVYVLFYATDFGREEHAEYRYNLTLLQEIRRYYYLGVRTGVWNLFLLNVVGNVMVFVPYGYFLPRLFDRCKNILLTAMFSLELSLAVELLQLVTRVGSFDVDDLLLNTIGGILGYIGYQILKRK